MLFVILILVAAFAYGLGYYLDYKDYNHGICKECGHRLKPFDTDSQEGRGYECPNCDRTVWVSYPVD